MTIPLLLAFVVAAVALAAGSTIALAVATYRLRAAARLNAESQTTRHARTALFSVLGILVAVIALLWSYGQFIVLERR